VFGAIILTLGVAVLADLFPDMVPAAVAVSLGASGLAGLVASLLLVRRAWLLRDAHLSQVLETLTTIDPLTGLKNRVTFSQLADRVLKRNAQTHRPVVLVVWNLGGLRGLNEAEGHAAGDRAVVSFARILEACARPTDLIGRIGGAQFAALLPGATKHAGMLLAARVGQQAWSEWHTKGFTAICGTSAYPEDGNTFDQLFAAATPSVDASTIGLAAGDLSNQRPKLRAVG
jgi:diguanylate cyclase (GGDEF)-like protein